jgi:uncharacterized membrane protein
MRQVRYPSCSDVSWSVMVWCGVMLGGRDGVGLWWMIFAHFIAIFVVFRVQQATGRRAREQNHQGKQQPD